MDDILITSSDFEEIQHVKECLNAKFESRTLANFIISLDWKWLKHHTVRSSLSRNL